LGVYSSDTWPKCDPSAHKYCDEVAVAHLTRLYEVTIHPT
jgi:hypothetical protein